LDPGNIHYRWSLAGVYQAMGNKAHKAMIGPLFESFDAESFQPFVRSSNFPFVVESVLKCDSKKAYEFAEYGHNIAPLGPASVAMAYLLRRDRRFMESEIALRAHLDFCPVSFLGLQQLGKLGEDWKRPDLVKESYDRLLMLGIPPEKMSVKIYGPLISPQSQPL
jgi:hypothetical protein